MVSDDEGYRKSVRNMSVVLALIVITIFAALFVPPYLNPVREALNDSASVASVHGFSLSLRLNTTTVRPDGHVAITARINNTTSQILNITTQNSWVNLQGLYHYSCFSGWPVAIGIMEGYYTSDNFREGTLISIKTRLPCPVLPEGPSYFLLEPHGSRAVVSINGTIVLWELKSTTVFGPESTLQGQQLSGTYTVIAADEWGDIAFAHFAA